MLCIYINNVFVFIHTRYTDIIEVFRGGANELVNYYLFSLAHFCHAFR